MRSLYRPIVIALLLSVCAAPLFGAGRPITVALVPDGLTADERLPLQNYLSERLGTEVRVFVPESYDAALDGLSRDTIDFACLGAVMYVRAHAKLGVIPLVQRTNDREFHSVFIAGMTSPVQSLKDLKGRTFAYGDINSASAHLIPYLEMKRAGLNPDLDLKFRYSGAHPMTVKLVETGIVDAGAVDETVFKSLVTSGKMDATKIRVFYTSKPFVDYAFVARKGVASHESQKFASALLSLKKGKNDNVLKILRATQFVEATDDEYDSIRETARELKLF